MANHPLQSSGPISLNDISKEFNRTSGSTTSLNSAKSGSYGSISSVNPNPTTGTNIVTGQPRNGLHLSDWYGCNYNTTPQTPGSAPVFLPTYNSVYGDNAVFATAHNTPVSQSQGFQIGAGYNTGVSRYQFFRVFLGYDTTAIVNATAANVSFTVTFNQLAKNPSNFILVQTNPQRAYNYQWTTANFNEGNASTIVCTNYVSVTAGTTGQLVKFDLNAAGLALINNNNNATFMIMEYDYDYRNTVTGIGSFNGSPIIRGNNTCPLAYS